MVDVRRALGVVALTCALALTGCTADAPAGPSPSPTPVVQTPTETARERQERLDYAAAEKSYRTFRAEFNDVLRKGGASRATKKMRQTAGGSYLADTSDVVEAYNGLRNRQVGAERIAFVRPSGYSRRSLVLNVCEDTSHVRTVNLSGKVIGKGEFRTLTLELKLIGSTWKLWSGSGRKVSSCD